MASILEAAVGDDREAGCLAESPRIFGIDCRAVAPTDAEESLRQRTRQDVEEDSPEFGLAAQMPRGIGVKPELVDRPAAGRVAGMDEAEAAGDVEIVDAELLQLLAILERFLEAVADEIMPQRKDDRQADID